MQLDKSQFRISAISKRKNILNKSNKDKIITNHLLNSSLYNNAKTIYCYVSLKNEIFTDTIIKTALNNNKQVAVPYCIDSNGVMEFYYINSIDDLVIGSFGIREPDIKKCKLANDYSESICIVPGLCFDNIGNRIGYGKGYYDRFLKKFTSVSIGLCYNDLITDNIPADKYDMQVDYIVSENGIFATKTGGKNG